MTLRRPAAAASLLLALALVSCSAPAEPKAPAAEKPSPAAPTPQASVEPVDAAQSPQPSQPAEDPACETIISTSAVKAFDDLGWTFEQKPFYIEDLELPDGLLCFWADYSVASDHGQLFGWSTITADDAGKAQSKLLAEGWKREDGPEGVYITENPEFSLGTDENGYGMTYLFGEGWVEVADTKQSLAMISWQG